jgi:hypothetical protein
MRIVVTLAEASTFKDKRQALSVVADYEEVFNEYEAEVVRLSDGSFAIQLKDVDNCLVGFLAE